MDKLLMTQTVFFVIFLIPIMIVFTYLVEALTKMVSWIVQGLKAPEHVSEPKSEEPEPSLVRARKSPYYRSREEFSRDNTGMAPIDDMVERCRGEVPPKKSADPQSEKDVEFLS